jgi:hypothetical protein
MAPGNNGKEGNVASMAYQITVSQISSSEGPEPLARLVGHIPSPRDVCCLFAVKERNTTCQHREEQTPLGEAGK